MTQSDYGSSRQSAPSVGVTAAFVAPFDRIRWGPVLAGLFAALSTLALLSVLGLAIGFSAWDPGDDASRYSTAAGIWSILSALIAFFIGGYLAARSAAAFGERNGVLNGGMVWAVAIPLMIFLVGGGMASLADMAVSGSNQQRVVYLDRGNGGGEAQTASAQIGDTITGASNPGSNNVGNNMPRTEDAANAAARGAWWTLVSLVLGLCAAAGGGYAGARSYDRGDDNTPRSEYTANADTGSNVGGA